MCLQILGTVTGHSDSSKSCGSTEKGCRCQLDAWALESTNNNELGLRRPGDPAICPEWTSVEKHGVRWRRQADLGVAGRMGVEMRLRLGPRRMQE
jgi:hypothetical protein